MKDLLNIRLSVYFLFFLVLYFVLSFLVPARTFDGPALTLFSVNSFLYGFYIAPILSAQKTRIEELHKIVRAEANAMFTMALYTRKMSDKLHDHYIGGIRMYCQKILYTKKHSSGEPVYEKLITDSVEYHGKEQVQVDKMLDMLVANQTNRSMLNMQQGNKVFNNEWWIILVLFSITLSFIMLIDVKHNLFLSVIKAFLSTGLSMLLVILIKLSTLTHKKAKLMWDPLRTLISTKFYRID
jgi:hypothetical protein